MSISSAVTEATNNKILPGDKTGLPWELWQIILSWLSAADLCRVSCVCKTWAELVISVDSTRWKELYLACSEWHHPFWPLNTNTEPPSWRLAYRDQYIFTKFWCQRQKSDTKHVTCTVIFKKNIFCRNIRVGPGLEHESLRTALSAANDYDRIVVHPGIYDEQFEISAKSPFELIGHGELGSVILVVGIKQLAMTTRISNLVLRAPWFTSLIININSGHLQVDNCIIEDGVVCAKSPSTVHLRFCTFRHASVVLQHMSASIIENCEFSQSNNANIFIEGHPKGDRSWAQSFLQERTKAALHQKQSLKEKPNSASSSTPTAHSSFTSKFHPTGNMGPSGETLSWGPGFSFTEFGESSLDVCFSGSHYVGIERYGIASGSSGIQVEKQGSVTHQKSCKTSANSATTVAIQAEKQGSLTNEQLCKTSANSTTTVAVINHNRNESHKDEHNITHNRNESHKDEHNITHNRNENHKDEHNITHNRNEYHKDEHNNTFPSDSENGLCSQQVPKSSQTVSGLLKQSSGEKAFQSNCVRNSARRKSSLESGRKSSHSCLQPETLEENSVNYTKGRDSSKDCSSKSRGVSEQILTSLTNTVTYQENLKQSSTKRNDHKNYDSNVSSQLDEHKAGCMSFCDSSNEDTLRKVENSGGESMCSQSLATAENSTVFPPSSRNVQLNTTKRRKQSTGSFKEGKQKTHSNNYDNEPVTNSELTAQVSQISNKSKYSLSESSHNEDVDQLVLSVLKEKSSEKLHISTNSSHENLKSKTLKNTCHQREEKAVEVLSLKLQATNSCKISEALSTDTFMLKPSDNAESSSHGNHNNEESGNETKSNNCCDVTGSDNPIIGSASAGMGTESHELAKSHIRNASASVGPESDELSQIRDEDNMKDLQNLQNAGQGHPCDTSCNQQQHRQNQPPIRRSQSEEVLAQSDDDDDDLSILDGIEDLDEPSAAESADYESSNQMTDSSSDEEESLHFTNNDQEFSSDEESVIMLPHLHEFHLDHLDSFTTPRGVDAEIASISSECTKPVPVNIYEDSAMSLYAEQIHGCLIHQCRMNHSKGGLMISLQAHAIVSECDISNVGYGIRSIQNSKVIILRNKIHHCQTSGIFLRLAASGLIAGNDIHSNNEAGIDIRKNADPLVQFNQIHHGKRSGIVVLGSGQGQIKRNNIFSNTEAGVYVLYGGNPVISENYIYEGRAAGVAINAGGKCCVVHNVIRANQWAGVDIRNGSHSLVFGNSIINGMSDGVVVGVDGRGSFENNLISGNAGCGIWIMAAQSFNVHGNQIGNNKHCGIMLLEKSSSMTNSMESQLDHFLTDVSQKTYCQYIDRSSSLETCSDLAVLQYNSIYCNKGQGILVEMNKKIKIVYNSIHTCLKEGILMVHEAPAVVEGNNVTGNGGSGIVTSTYDKTHLTGNGIYDNAQHGVVCRNNCVIDCNDIVGNQMCAVVVKDKQIVQISKNRLCSSVVAAVKGEELSVITAVRNMICDRGGGDFSCKGSLNDSENILVRPDSFARKSSKSEFSKNDFLTNPPPRPDIPPPPPPPTTAVALSYNMTASTKATVASRDACEQGSRLCVIV